MENFDRKKVAKTAVLTASLAAGLIAVSSQYSEAQSSGGSSKKAYVYITPPPGVNAPSQSCGTLSGNDC